jgi:hypothetical protein
MSRGAKLGQAFVELRRGNFVALRLVELQCRSPAATVSKASDRFEYTRKIENASAR